MMNFMREGGFNMWLMVATAIVVAGVGLTRPREKRAGVFHAGMILLILESIFGLVAGMKAVCAYTERPAFASMANQAALVAEGLGELANNGVLGVGLALVLGLGFLVTRRTSSALAR
jgi:hypothetical protein